MNCTTSKEQISQMLDGELEQEILQPLFQHLSECSDCRIFFSQTQIIKNTLQHLPVLLPDKKVDEKFAVLELIEKKQPLMNRKFMVSVPSIVLSGILALMVSILLLISFNPKNENASPMTNYDQFR